MKYSKRLYFIGAIFAFSLSACSSGSGGPTQTAAVSTEPVVEKSAPHAPYGGPNNPGALEPVLTALSGSDVRIPHTDQTEGDVQLNVVGEVVSNTALDASSILGHPITHVASPNDDMKKALQSLSTAAKDNNILSMTAAATELEAILLGKTEGRIYDGFPMLNYNVNTDPDHPFVNGQIPGEYKMKLIRDTGLTAPGIDGEPRKIWEVDVNMLWYDGQFDSDTFLIRVPYGAHKNDTLRVNYKIYSLVREEFSPTTVMSDQRTSVSFPFKGFDSAWVPVQGNTVTEITIDHPPLRMLRGVYTWGWRQHPPRIQFLQPIFEIKNAHTDKIELEPQGKSFAMRNKTLSIEGIGDAAPEKKMYTVVQAVLGGASPDKIYRMLNESSVAPRGVWQEWADLVKNQLQLPPEAREMLSTEGITAGTFGSYDFVSVYLNNEMYGDGPRGAGEIEVFGQRETRTVKVINLDNNTHYYRTVDFGKALNDDISQLGNAGSHSFELFNFKPTYGAPKVAEMQWRAGWGFRPHFDVIQQADVFPRPEDREHLLTLQDGEGNDRLGYQFSDGARKGDFRFNPPGFIIGASMADPSSQRLKEADGSDGLVIGQLTEGYGLAKMCENGDTHPMGGPCGEIDPTFNPHGKLNWPPTGPTSLRFPPFLRNPNPDGGDIIPPTPIWKPFLWINPNNGTLFIDEDDPSKGYWADLTYAHGSPIKGNSSMTATVEAPRASGEVFYQFDDLFHDNAIFSPHPR